MERTLRAFVAFKLPGTIIEHVVALQSALKACGLKLRWVKPQNLHMTLKFLGDIPESAASHIGEVIQSLVQNESPLEMTLQGMGVFPTIKRPRVLWVGFGGQNDRFMQLHHKLEEQFAQIGINRDKRRFKAHLTIARIKGAIAPDLILQALKDVGNYEPIIFIAQWIALYQSELRPQGAIYTPLVEAKLASP